MERTASQSSKIKTPFQGLSDVGMSAQLQSPKKTLLGLSEWAMGVHSLPEPKIKTPFQVCLSGRWT